MDYELFGRRSFIAIPSSDRIQDPWHRFTNMTKKEKNHVYFCKYDRATLPYIHRPERPQKQKKDLLGLDIVYNLRNDYISRLRPLTTGGFPVVSCADTLGDGGADVDDNHLGVLFEERCR
jgi:hypothetical protein